MDKLKVLFLAAAPSKASERALGEEVRAIEAKIRAAEHRDRLELVAHWDVRLDDLAGLLMRHRPHVVHLTGETTATETESPGVPGHVSPQALARVLRVLKDNVRVVLINASHSAAQAQEIADSIDCAVGMSGPIGDEHAIPFAAEFYQALAYNESVKTAYDLGVVRLKNEGLSGSEVLVQLKCRAGFDPASFRPLDRQSSASPPLES